MRKLKPLSRDKYLCGELLFDKAVLEYFLLSYYNSLADTLVVNTITGFIAIIVIMVIYLLTGFVIMHYYIYPIYILLSFFLLIIFVWYLNTTEYKIKKVIKALASNEISCYYVTITDKKVTYSNRYLALITNSIYVQLDGFMYDTCRHKDKLLIFTDNKKVLFYTTNSFLNQSEFSLPLGSCPVTISDLIEFCTIYYKSISR